MSKSLTYATLKEAVEGSAAAFRLTLRLEPASPKVFPPTYEGGKYAVEDRFIGKEKEKVSCVLLDSVPSQANRMEFALQDAIDNGKIKFPIVYADFSAVDNPGVPKITSLQAPHRIADAILRDSTDNGTPFRKTDIGKDLDKLSNGYATPLLKHAPHCLVWGMWDSTGPRGGLGVKFARALISEIVGVNAVKGVKTSSRIDPLNIRVNAGILYKSEGGWTLDESKALKKGKEPIKLGTTEKKKGDGKPSEANHGNVTPSYSDGSFTIEYAEQSTVLSLPALRRLRFPAKPGDTSTPAGNVAARTYLAALGLLGATLAIENGFDLRSRCVLHARNAVEWTLLGKPGDADKAFILDVGGAVAIYEEALTAVDKAGLPVKLEPVKLTPSADLVTLVKKSMEIAAAESGEGGE